MKKRKRLRRRPKTVQRGRKQYWRTDAGLLVFVANLGRQSKDINPRHLMNT